MDKSDKPFLDPPIEPLWRNSGYANSQSVHITDKRVAELLLVLHQLDESLGALEELSKPELSELVSDAITACGFVDPIEARYAIAAVLEKIGVPDSMPESS